MRQRPEFTLTDLLTNATERDPTATAVVDGEDRYTYADLSDQSAVLCGRLIEMGIGRGERVGIYMEKSWEGIVAMLAASRAGAAFVNINPLLKSAQVKYIARDCEMRLLIGDSNKLDTLDRDVVRQVLYKGKRPDSWNDAADIAGALTGKGTHAGRESLETDLGTILYTSGSTGSPKGVAFSQHNLVVGAQIVSHYLENTAADRILSVLPFSFDYGLNQLTTAINVGATLIIQHSRLPGDLLRGLRRSGATGLAGVPPLWSLLLRSTRSLEEEPLTGLRYVTNSGGRIPQANLDELRRLLAGTRIFLMYGLTEAFRSTYLPPEEIGRGSECIGRPIPNTEILVMRDGRECAPGEVGELVHRGPTVAQGYWGDEEATRRAYRPHPLGMPELRNGERVVYSGDLVRRDEEGYLYFVGRDDAMIKSQGYRMSPEEVEEILLGSGLVREACAFGEPDPEVGQRIVTVITLREGLNESMVEAVRDHALRNAPPYMVPARIHVVDELPRSATGKIDRKSISASYASGGD